MKDQYFGDFGDYQKISLLKILKEENLNIVVHWLKTKDDKSNDGKHIVYLNSPSLWRDYEPEIYDYLNKCLVKYSRSLFHIENSLFCRDIAFVDDLIEDDTERVKSLKKIVENPEYDLVFFDPDNGIEVKSTNKKNSYKYVLWDEIRSAFNAGKSVMVYQHFSRSNREVFIEAKLKDLRQKLGAEAFALKVKHSVYLFACHKKDVGRIKRGLAKFSKRWKPLALLIQ
jgi:hypothetical protein